MAGSEGRPTTTRKEAPISDIALILKAADFAAHKHRSQRRKGRSERPYVGHCIEVALLIAEVGKIEDASVLAAALLHDTVEDTKTTREDIREEFGSAIDDLVSEVSDDKDLDKDVRKAAGGACGASFARSEAHQAR
jgi:guanosine-3',5'-bis(diphosphate) 3'-pyrophosphohydrolase